MKRAHYFSTHITAYRIQQTIHKMTREFNKIQHELTSNLKTMDERNTQLNELCFYKQNIEYQSIKEQIDTEQKLSFELKQQNNELNRHLSDHMMLLKTNKIQESQLNANHTDLLEKIHLKQEEIQIEKAIKQEYSQILTKLKKDLKRKQKFLSIHHRQEDHLKVKFSINLEIH